MCVCECDTSIIVHFIRLRLMIGLSALPGNHSGQTIVAFFLFSFFGERTIVAFESKSQSINPSIIGLLVGKQTDGDTANHLWGF